MGSHAETNLTDDQMATNAEPFLTVNNTAMALVAAAEAEVKAIPLTKGYVAIIDDEDFERCSKLRWHAYVSRTPGLVYAHHNPWLPNIRRHTTLALHRFVLRVSDPKLSVDHKNHDGLDCRKANLRVTSHEGNNRNARKRTACTSRFKGLTFEKSRGLWKAAIKMNGKSINLGRFASELDAARAYDRAATDLFGEFAFTNEMMGAYK